MIIIFPLNIISFLTRIWIAEAIIAKTENINNNNNKLKKNFHNKYVNILYDCTKCTHGIGIEGREGKGKGKGKKRVKNNNPLKRRANGALVWVNAKRKICKMPRKTI